MQWTWPLMAQTFKIQAGVFRDPEAQPWDNPCYRSVHGVWLQN